MNKVLHRGFNNINIGTHIKFKGRPTWAAPIFDGIMVVTIF